MFPLALPLLIGGGLGALTNKKNPLKGALLGAGMGALGGAVAPAMGGLLGNAGTAAAYGTGLGTQQTAMLAAQEAGMGGLGGLKTALGYAEPISQAMGTAQQFMGPDEAPVPPPQLQQQNGGQILAQLAQPQQVQTSEQERMMRRQQRRGLLG